MSSHHCFRKQKNEINTASFLNSLAQNPSHAAWKNRIKKKKKKKQWHGPADLRDTFSEEFMSLLKPLKTPAELKETAHNDQGCKSKPHTIFTIRKIVCVTCVIFYIFFKKTNIFIPLQQVVFRTQQECDVNPLFVHYHNHNSTSNLYVYLLNCFSQGNSINNAAVS